MSGRGKVTLPLIMIIKITTIRNELIKYVSSNDNNNDSNNDNDK